MNPRDIQAVTRRNQGIAAALNEMADLLEIMEVNGPARGSASKAKAATPGNAKAYEAHAAPFKAKAYRTAARNVSGLNYEITAENLAEVVKSVRGVGKSIGAAIAEYVNEGQMSALQALRGNKHVKAYKFFAGILGVGPSTAAKWIRAGIYTRQALQRAASSGTVRLTNAQTLGLRHYDDLQRRIPRETVKKIGHYVKALLLGLNPDLTFEIAGSYRRGRLDSGDVDILVTTPRFSPTLLTKFADGARLDPGYAGTVSLGPERLTFLYAYDGVVRQIDVLNVRKASFGAALLYFTGSWEFNERMRGHAKSLGFRLNQHGLYSLADGRPNALAAPDERRIFELLGLDYVAPRNRV